MSHLNNVKRLSNPAQKKKINKGIFASEHSKNDVHELWRENSVIFLPYQMRAFYFII